MAAGPESGSLPGHFSRQTKASPSETSPSAYSLQTVQSQGVQSNALHQHEIPIHDVQTLLRDHPTGRNVLSVLPAGYLSKGCGGAGRGGREVRDVWGAFSGSQGASTIISFCKASFKLLRYPVSEQNHFLFDFVNQSRRYNNY